MVAWIHENNGSRVWENLTKGTLQTRYENPGEFGCIVAAIAHVDGKDRVFFDTEVHCHGSNGCG